MLFRKSPFALAVTLGVAASSMVLLTRCNDNPLPPSSAAGTFGGNLEISCPGISPKQQQVSFNKDQSCPAQSQNISFSQNRAPLFSFNVDCQNHVVAVKNVGRDPKRVDLPIDNDGKVRGQMEFFQLMDDDGLGTSQCFANLEVEFEGDAKCDGPGEQTVNMQTKMNFREANDNQLNNVQIEAGDDDVDHEHGGGSSGSNSSRLVRDVISENQTASPTPSPSITPSPTPSVTAQPAVHACKIQNPCALVSSAQFSCPAPQASPTPSASPTVSPSPSPGTSGTP